MAHQLLQVFSTQFDCHQFITLSVLLCFQQDERDAEPHTVRLQQLRLVMVALCNRADHYIFILFILLLSNSSFFSSPNLSDRKLDVYHTLAHDVALVRI